MINKRLLSLLIFFPFFISVQSNFGMAPKTKTHRERKNPFAQAIAQENWDSAGRIVGGLKGGDCSCRSLGRYYQQILDAAREASETRQQSEQRTRAEREAVIQQLSDTIAELRTENERLAAIEEDINQAERDQYTQRKQLINQSGRDDCPACHQLWIELADDPLIEHQCGHVSCKACFDIWIQHPACEEDPAFACAICAEERNPLRIVNNGGIPPDILPATETRNTSTLQSYSKLALFGTGCLAAGFTLAKLLKR